MANALHAGQRNDPAEGPHLDGMDRRGFLKCMAWAGTGLVWAVSGGVLSSCTLAKPAAGQVLSPTAGTVPPPAASFYYVPGEHDVFADGGQGCLIRLPAARPRHRGSAGPARGAGGPAAPRDRRARGELHAGPATAGPRGLHAELGDGVLRGDRPGRRAAGLCLHGVTARAAPQVRPPAGELIAMGSRAFPGGVPCCAYS